MRSRTLIILIFTMLTAAGSDAADRGADPISGAWAVSFRLGTTTVPGTFRLTLDGETVTGTVESAHTGPGKVSDGSWTNGVLKCNLVFASHDTIVVTGRLGGDKLVGEFRTEGMEGTWEATRTASEAMAGI